MREEVNDYVPLPLLCMPKYAIKAAGGRFYVLHFYREAISLQIGFPLDENFSSYSVMTLP